MAWQELRERFNERLGDGNPNLNEAVNRTYRTLRIKAEDKTIPGKIYARAFRTAVIGLAVEAVSNEFVKEYENIILGNYHKEVVFQSSVKDLIEAFKLIGQQFVYRTPANLKLELMGRHVINQLLDFFWEGAKLYEGGSDAKTFQQKISALMSDNYKNVFKREKAISTMPIEYLRLQLVTDYVCGMTDSFALNLHRDLKHGYRL